MSSVLWDSFAVGLSLVCAGCVAWAAASSVTRAVFGHPHEPRDQSYRAFSREATERLTAGEMAERGRRS